MVGSLSVKYFTQQRLHSPLTQFTRRKYGVTTLARYSRQLLANAAIAASRVAS
jgi:hypothetical protein